MYGKLKTHNFFVTTLDAVINDTDVTGTIVLADKTVNGVTLEDGSYIFWMLVGLNAPTELEIFRIVSVSGKTLTYDKRISPNGIMPHSIGDLAQCNDMGELINFIGDSTQFFGYTETVNGLGNELKVNVLGGTVMDITLTDIIVPDVTLTMVDNITNYIYLDDHDNTIKTTTVNPVSYYTISTVVTLSGAITTITDTRVVYSGKMGIPLSITETARDAIVSPRNGSIIFNDTTGTLNRYEGGQRIDFSFGGVTVQRLSETVEGKARYSTNAEYAAQLDTGVDGAPLVPKVSQVASSAGFASTTVAGVVEEATDAELLAGTATGTTGARLFIGPAHAKKIITYDAVVATSGGDYTSVYAALTAGKRRIFVKNGVYNSEPAWIVGSAYDAIIHSESFGGAIINFLSSGAGNVIELRSGEIVGLTLNFNFVQGGQKIAFNPTNIPETYNGLTIKNCKITITISTAGGAFTTSCSLYGGADSLMCSFENCSIALSGAITSPYFVGLGQVSTIFDGCLISSPVTTCALGGNYENCKLSTINLITGGNATRFLNSSLYIAAASVLGNFNLYSLYSTIDIAAAATGNIYCTHLVGNNINGNSGLVVFNAASYKYIYSNTINNIATLSLGDSSVVSGNYIRIKSGGDITFASIANLSSNHIRCTGSIWFYGSSCNMTGNVIYETTAIRFEGNGTCNWNSFNGNNCFTGSIIYWGTGTNYNNVVGNTHVSFSGTIGTNAQTSNMV